jgi:hypothetical protein|tara:strand:- start:476 stop:706 length:231 start_codon:yes stop_codon:yes gene_type:complete
MAFNQINIKDCLCDMYDIKRKVKQTKVVHDVKGHTLEISLFNAPKDNDGTIFTLGDCIDNVIEQLEQELKLRGQEI